MDKSAEVGLHYERASCAGCSGPYHEQFGILAGDYRHSEYLGFFMASNSAGFLSEDVFKRLAA